MKKIFRGRRIIPCLDIKDGKIVKGIKFQNLRNFGDPFELALLYEKQGADEIILLNIQGEAGKADMENLLKKLSKELSASIIAGGGVYSIQDVENYLRAGADRVSISSAAVKNPDLVKEAVSLFGKEKIIVAIDAKNENKEDEVNLINFAKTIEDMGAGEILLTSISADGVKAGYDIAMLNRVCKVVTIPVIASGGCGKLEHFIEVFKETKCSAALAASVFHEEELRVDEVKKALLDIHFEKSELIPAIVQDIENNQVLMLAYMNLESLEKTLESGFTWFYSRSRNELWNKGATSGNYQKLVSITPDCDNDALLVKVVQSGPACTREKKVVFTGQEVYIAMGKSLANTLTELYKVIEKRKSEKVKGSYTCYLFDSGINKILKKCGEECSEVIIAAKDSSSKEESDERNQFFFDFTNEVGDLLYHLLVLLVELDVGMDDINKVLRERRKS